MIEVIRRLFLAAGVVAAIVLAMYTPPLLFQAHAVDFARDYANYGRSAWPGDIAERLIEKPASLEEYIREKVDTRRIDVSGPGFVSFVSRLKDASASRAEASAEPGIDGPELFLRPDDPPLDRLMPAFQASRDSGWLNTFVAVASPGGTEFFEVLLVTEPRDSRAPRSMVYPLRAHAWWALAAGFVAYLAFAWRRRRADTVTYDPLGSVLPLDAFGTLWLAICVFVPLWATNTTEEAFGNEFGLTVFFGLLALLAVPAFLSAARKAAFAIAVGPERIVFRSLFGRRELATCDITNVEDLTAGKYKTGVVLHLAGQEALKLDWTDLERFEVLLKALPVPQG